jgi:hypothetical protein
MLTFLYMRQQRFQIIHEMTHAMGDTPRGEEEHPLLVALARDFYCVLGVHIICPSFSFRLGRCISLLCFQNGSHSMRRARLGECEYKCKCCRNRNVEMCLRGPAHTRTRRNKSRAPIIFTYLPPMPAAHRSPRSADFGGYASKQNIYDRGTQKEHASIIALVTPHYVENGVS